MIQINIFGYDLNIAVTIGELYTHKSWEAYYISQQVLKLFYLIFLQQIIISKRLSVIISQWSILIVFIEV